MFVCIDQAVMLTPMPDISGFGSKRSWVKFKQLSWTPGDSIVVSQLMCDRRSWQLARSGAQSSIWPHVCNEDNQGPLARKRSRRHVIPEALEDR